MSSDNDAYQGAPNLLQIFEAIYRPIPVEPQDPHTGQENPDPSDGYQAATKEEGYQPSPSP